MLELRIQQILPPVASWVTAAVLLAGCALAQAANFVVSPVRVELSAARPSAALSVTNEMAEEPVVVELHLLAWSQKDGADVYASTDDLLATPPIFTIAPGASRLLRVGLRRPASADREVCYRLILREVPPPPKPDFAGVQIALEMSLPVFVKPPMHTAPSLQWTLERQAGGAMGLMVKNEGNAHAQIANLVLSEPGITAPIGSFPQFAYVLPGESRRLTLERGEGQLPGNGATSLQLKAYSDAGDIDARLAAPNQ